MRRHLDSTLMRLTKKELIEYVRMAEHNQEVAEEKLAQQAENMKDWAPVARGKWIERPYLMGTTRVCSRCGRITGCRTEYSNSAPTAVQK